MSKIRKAPLTCIGLCALTIALGGCADKSDVAALREQVQGLTARLNMAEGHGIALDNRLGNAERALAMSPGRRFKAEFDPAEGSYQIIDGNPGQFAVSIKDVRQFADGVKLTINLGNISGATFVGAKLKLRYGSRPPDDPGAADYTANWQAWNNALQTKEENVIANLLPGYWNPVQVVLPKIDAKNFGFVEASIETNQISLR